MTMGEVNSVTPQTKYREKPYKAPGTPAAPTVALGTQSYPNAVKMRLTESNQKSDL